MFRLRMILTFAWAMIGAFASPAAHAESFRYFGAGLVSEETGETLKIGCRTPEGGAPDGNFCSSLNAILLKSSGEETVLNDPTPLALNPDEHSKALFEEYVRGLVIASVGFRDAKEINRISYSLVSERFFSRKKLWQLKPYPISGEDFRAFSNAFSRSTGASWRELVNRVVFVNADGFVVYQSAMRAQYSYDGSRKIYGASAGEASQIFAMEGKRKGIDVDSRREVADVLLMSSLAPYYRYDPKSEKGLTLRVYLIPTMGRDRIAFGMHKKFGPVIFNDYFMVNLVDTGGAKETVLSSRRFDGIFDGNLGR